MAWRFELKYLVDTVSQSRLEPLIATFMVPGEHVHADGTYPVLSQYFDGPALPFYLDKISGIESRLKLRLRTYNWRFDRTIPWFLEIKRKENSSIDKLRIPVSSTKIDPLDPTTWDALQCTLQSSFISIRDLMRLQPTAQVWYQRAVYETPDGTLRLTWDNMIRSLYPGEHMCKEIIYDSMRAVLPDHYSILEIKTKQTIPQWLTNVIRHAALTPQTISKYVLAMDALGLSRKVLATC